MCQSGVLLDDFADFVAALARHDDVGENHIGDDFTRLSHGVIAVVRRDDLDVLVRERKSDKFLNDDRIVGQEKFLGHGPPVRTPNKVQPLMSVPLEPLIVAFLRVIEWFFAYR